MSVSKIEKAFLEGLKDSVDEAFEELNTIQASDIPVGFIALCTFTSIQFQCYKYFDIGNLKIFSLIGHL